jgi:hypothetical protein
MAQRGPRAGAAPLRPGDCPRAALYAHQHAGTRARTGAAQSGALRGSDPGRRGQRLRTWWIGGREVEERNFAMTRWQDASRSPDRGSTLAFPAPAAVLMASPTLRRSTRALSTAVTAAVAPTTVPTISSALGNAVASSSRTRLHSPSDGESSPLSEISERSVRSPPRKKARVATASNGMCAIAMYDIVGRAEQEP